MGMAFGVVVRVVVLHIMRLLWVFRRGTLVLLNCVCGAQWVDLLKMG
jgi:hypothetical protein